MTRFWEEERLTRKIALKKKIQRKKDKGDMEGCHKCEEQLKRLDKLIVEAKKT